MTYQIDGEDLYPQPTDHNWDPPEILGHDGDRAPIYPKYRSATLETTVMLAKQLWLQYRDGAAHSVTLPTEGTTNEFTTYTGVFIDSVEIGRVSRKKGMDGVIMRLNGIEA